MERKPYPRDVSDEEWGLVAPYLTRITADGPQREPSLREACNGLRWIVRAGAAWRLMPHDLPPGHTVYQPRHRWLTAGVFDALVQDRRAVLRLAQGRTAEPSAALFDSRTLQATPASGTRAGYDGAKRRRGSTVHTAVDTLGHLWAAHVTAASAQDRSQVTRLAAKMQAVTGDAVAGACVDQGYPGAQAAEEAHAQHLRLDVVTLPEAKTGFVRLPRRGAWSAATRGQHGFAAWRGMMNNWPRHSRAGILWPSQY